MAWPILGCLEITSAKDFSAELSIFASGRIFGQGQKAVTFFAKVSQEWYIATSTAVSPV